MWGGQQSRARERKGVGKSLEATTAAFTGFAAFSAGAGGGGGGGGGAGDAPAPSPGAPGAPAGVPLLGNAQGVFWPTQIWKS